MRIISRAEWGAKYPTRPPFVADPKHQRRGLLPHWNGPRMHDPANGYGNMRGIQNYHQGRGWSDFAYSFGIDAHGRIFEGRGMEWDEFATDSKENGHKWYTVYFMIGADHVPGPTPVHVTSAECGHTFFMQNVQPLTPEMVDAFVWLRKTLVAAELCGLEVAAHSDFKCKSCPGPHALYLSRLLNGQPTSQPPSGILEDDMQYIIRSDQGPAFWAENGQPVGSDFGFWKDEDTVKVVTVPHEVWQRRLAGYQVHKHLAGDIANRVIAGLPREQIEVDAVGAAVVNAIREVWQA